MFLRLRELRKKCSDPWSFEKLIEGGDTEKKQNSGGWFNEKV